MKTSNQFQFTQIGHEFLDISINQLFRQHYLMIQIFFNQTDDSGYAHLIILVEHKKDVDELMRKKWVDKVFKEYKVKVCVFYSSEIHHRFSLGDPFIELYCRPSAIIYQNADYGKALTIKRNWKKFSKKFEDYKDSLFHDHDLLLTQVRGFVTDESSVSALLAYENVFKYDLGYLEELYTGNGFNSENLNERITNLSKHIPEIKSHFVSQSRSEYYLIHLIGKAREASKDDLFFKNEMFEAFSIAEDSLSGMIEKRLHQLKKMIKIGCSDKEDINETAEANDKDEVLDMAVEVIVKSIEVEEIYIFHKAVYGFNTTYYLLLLGLNIGNDKLKSITQSLKSHNGDQSDFVLISHDRYWIQKNLYFYQSFFANVIQSKNKIYQSHPFHPEPHWEYPHNQTYADLDYYFEATTKFSKQFLALAEDEKENYQGLPYFFTLFFLSFCRTYIYAKLCYMPNYLSNYSLWRLCEFADPELRKYNYLFEEFWTKFFPYLDYHMVLHHHITNLKKEEVTQMKVIVEKLIKNLQKISSKIR
ncbi:hypothetical protein PQ459_00530 [Chryseobacterium sp. KACC 21268]|nr:hypothetical protein PQ459_00530 [Chryseobacterium sp. KACC 21268]